MFWTVFLSMLLVAYLIGFLLALGVILSHWGDTIGKEAKLIDYCFAAIVCILSWVSIGMFLSVIAEEIA